MKSEKIIIANLKCDGCANTIVKKLSEIEGVHQVKVNQIEDSVEISCEDQVKREDLKSKLHSLGYPEATEENGLLLQLKSYASCVVGRMSSKSEKAK